uniref:Serpentine receptor class gamma n=1 Tax=Panagrellus redivivus TaxID=6233 RepID=A0A7E4UZM9_PANRE
MLTSVVFFITRTVIFFHRYDTTKIPTSIGALANYFHDSAYFQLPMNPILMTLERLIATKCVRTYELSQTTKIVTTMVLISWTYATWMNFINAYKETFDVYFITVYTHFGLQTATFILMLFIYRTNLKRYLQIKAKTLTERYQTAENIRLLRATFKFTIINVVWNLMLLGLSFTLTIKDPTMRERIMVYVSSIWDLIIALGLFSTLLIFFDAVGILRRVYSPFYTNNTKNVVIKSVTGYVVPLKAEADDYFDQLKKAWK